MGIGTGPPFTKFGEGLLVGSCEAVNSQPESGLPSAPDHLSTLSLGIFPEDDIPEEAYRKLQEGRQGRKAKKRLPKSQLQNKPGRTSALGGGGAYPPIVVGSMPARLPDVGLQA